MLRALINFSRLSLHQLYYLRYYGNNKILTFANRKTENEIALRNNLRKGILMIYLEKTVILMSFL